MSGGSRPRSPARSRCRSGSGIAACVRSAGRWRAATCWRGPPTSSIDWSGGKAPGFCLGRRGSSEGATFDTSDVVAKAIHERIGDRHLLLLTDFDGTLADLAPTPDEAALSDEVRADMALLAVLPSVTFGVVSGRRLADVGQRVGAAAEFVAGLHG